MKKSVLMQSFEKDVFRSSKLDKIFLAYVLLFAPCYCTKRCFSYSELSICVCFITRNEGIVRCARENVASIISDWRVWSVAWPKGRSTPVAPQGPKRWSRWRRRIVAGGSIPRPASLPSRRARIEEFCSAAGVSVSYILTNNQLLLVERFCLSVRAT